MHEDGYWMSEARREARAISVEAGSDDQSEHTIELMAIAWLHGHIKGSEMTMDELKAAVRR